MVSLRGQRKTDDMNSYKAQGIVLHTIKYGDSSLVAYVLTDAAGRQSYMVQGVRSCKGKGNKTALLQPMFLVEFEAVRGGRSHMDRIKEAKLLHPLQHIPFDIRKSTISLFMAEVLYKLVREVEPDSTLFGFVKESVLVLDGLESGISNFHLWFLVQLSRFLGFYPANRYAEGDCFDIIEGCFTATQPDHSMIMNRPNSRLLDTMLYHSPDKLGEVALPRTQRADFLASLLLYYGYHLDTINNIQSIKILGELF